MDDVVGNIFVDILSSSGSIFVESGFILGSHSSGMSRGSFFLTFVLFGDYTGSSSDMSFETCSVGIWSDSGWGRSLSPDGGVESGWVSSDNPLVVVNVVLNVFIDVLGSSGGIFVEGSLLLGSHGIGVGRSSSFLTFVLFSDNISSSSNMLFE